MRNYIRHPSDIPLEYRVEEPGPGHREQLKNVSYGGLAFESHDPLEVGTVIALRIVGVKPVFETKGRVVWHQQHGDHFEIGVEFLHQDDVFQVRMVEQVCHIEHYKREVLTKEGRNLSGQEAAQEWIAKYAAEFYQDPD